MTLTDTAIQGFWIGVGLAGTLSIMNLGIRQILKFFKIGIPKEGG